MEFDSHLPFLIKDFGSFACFETNLAVCQSCLAIILDGYPESNIRFSVIPPTHHVLSPSPSGRRHTAERRARSMCRPVEVLEVGSEPVRYESPQTCRRRLSRPQFQR